MLGTRLGDGWQEVGMGLVRVPEVAAVGCCPHSRHVARKEARWGGGLLLSLLSLAGDFWMLLLHLFRWLLAGLGSVACCWRYCWWLSEVGKVEEVKSLLLGVA